MAFRLEDALKSPWGNELTPDRQIGGLVTVVMNSFFVVSGITILFFFVMAGIKMIQSAGGNPQEAEKAKQAMTSAVVGFVIMFTAYWIIKIIELITGTNFITEPTFN